MQFMRANVNLMSSICIALLPPMTFGHVGPNITDIIHSTAITASKLEIVSTNSISTVLVATPLFVTIFLFCSALCFIIYKHYYDRISSQQHNTQANHIQPPNIDDIKYAHLVDWFTNTLELPQYLPIFIQNGYNSIYRIKELTDKSQLNNIGITKLGHQGLIISEIMKLRIEEDINPSVSMINIKITPVFEPKSPIIPSMDINSENVGDMPDLPLSQSSTKKMHVVVDTESVNVFKLPALPRSETNIEETKSTDTLQSPTVTSFRIDSVHAKVLPALTSNSERSFSDETDGMEPGQQTKSGAITKEIVDDNTNGGIILKMIMDGMEEPINDISLDIRVDSVRI